MHKQLREKLIILLLSSSLIIPYSIFGSTSIPNTQYKANQDIYKAELAKISTTQDSVVNIQYGTDEATVKKIINMPILLEYSNGFTQSIRLKDTDWSIPEYSSIKSGNFKATAQITLPEGITNPNSVSLTVSQDIQVAPQQKAGILNDRLPTLFFEKGTIPTSIISSLPTEVQYIGADGLSKIALDSAKWETTYTRESGEGIYIFKNTTDKGVAIQYVKISEKQKEETKHTNTTPSTSYTPSNRTHDEQQEAKKDNTSTTATNTNKENNKNGGTNIPTPKPKIITPTKEDLETDNSTNMNINNTASITDVANQSLQNTSSSVIEFTLGTKRWKKNGKIQSISLDVVPVAKKGRFYVPLRNTGSALGLTDSQIKWDKNKQQVTLISGAKTMILKIGSSVANINGSNLLMDGAPYIDKSGRVMLPLSQITKLLLPTGTYSIKWDATTKTMKLTIS